MLPNPSDHPAADIVIYDGECQFCRRQVQRLHWFDRSGRLAFLSLHDPATARLLPDLSHEELMKEMLVLPAGLSQQQPPVRYGGARAARYLSRRLPLLWWLAPLLHLPGSLPFWNWSYQLVASKRYWLNKRYRSNEALDGEGCTSGNCDLHFQSSERRS